jgi:hypothetical protein
MGEATMKAKLIAAASWIGLLISAVSEYAFDADFPLTPSLWLVIAICSVVVGTAHAAIGSRIHDTGKRETVAYRPGDASSLAASAGFISNEETFTGNHASLRLGALAIGRATLRRGHRRVPPAEASIEPLIFLNPATTRGPPWSDNQIDRTLGRPARHLSTAPLPFALHLSGSSPLNINETVGEPS